MIQVRGLVKRFGRHKALEGVDLTVRAGRVLGVLGPNGAGKTTMVRTLATLVRPDAGTVRIGGLDVIRNADLVRRMIGLTGQYASVDGDLSGAENLVLIGRLLGSSRRDARRRASDLLGRFELGDVAERPSGLYSGGQRRRLDLAASLVGTPKVLCLDEPTTGLDPHVRRELWRVVRQLVTDGVTVVLTTQYLEEADQLADRIAVFDKGKVVAEGTADELKRRVGGQTVQVRPTLLADMEPVAQVVRKVTETEPVRNAETGTLTAPVADPMLLAVLVRKLDQAGLPVDELALRLPSLDEAFLALTGDEPDSRPVPEGTAV